MDCTIYSIYFTKPECSGVGKKKKEKKKGGGFLLSDTLGAAGGCGICLDPVCVFDPKKGKKRGGRGSPGNRVNQGIGPGKRKGIHPRFLRQCFISSVPPSAGIGGGGGGGKKKKKGMWSAL